MNIRTVISRLTRSRTTDLQHQVKQLTESRDNWLKTARQARTDRDELADRLEKTETERDTYQKHSVMANQLGWRIAQAVDAVPEGTESVEADPGELLDQLITDRDKARAEIADLTAKLADEEHARRRLTTQRDNARAVTRSRERLLERVTEMLYTSRGKTVREAVALIEQRPDVDLEAD